MKFAKELERDAVPEWRIKYLNYKAGKKYVRAVSRAINRVNGTPHTWANATPQSFHTANTHRGAGTSDEDGGDSFLERTTSAGDRGALSTPIPIGQGRRDEALPGNQPPLQYGSFLATPPEPNLLAAHPRHATVLELPGPAIPQAAEPSEPAKPSNAVRRMFEADRKLMPRSVSAGDTRGPLLPKSQSSGRLTQSPSQLRRLFSHHAGLGSKLNNSKKEIGLGTFDLVKEREAEFYRFMDSELEKVETFYKMKEQQAEQRLAVLKEQLHEMRNRRIHELAEASRRRDHEHHGEHEGNGQDRSNGWVQPLKDKMFPPGPNSKAMQTMPRTPLIGSASTRDGGRDYSRRPEGDDVSYRTAKRKLKLAMQEFYRGLELLKSFALLNRTAFRKLNKKFDKATNARPPYRYVNEKVTKAWFVQSDTIDGHIKIVEDLYARYFEGGNHKLAAGKLRSLTKKHPNQSGSSFQNGFLVGTGIVFSIQGLIYGAQLLWHEDEDMREQTSYLMQIYGGYFLVLLLFSLFCLNCMIWTNSKINYPFIFEFDQRHHLDWIRLAEFPSFFLLLFGVFIWANFSRYGPDELYLYYPVILIGITALIIFLPFPVLAHRSRRWFVYSHWRLLLAGIYPVEFRDFFLGDIYCSLTYATANAELFFCLYTRQWEEPVQCNSSHSRLMGFLAALPPIWRFLQCIRRYKDTRNVFPHLVNCGKYAMTIMCAVALSMYRVHGSRGNLALFITFSVINSIYCSIWDLFMDFSLLQTESRHIGLRDILALNRRWPYYAIMVADPIIRFAWIFYAIFTYDRQHSTLVSFLVALVEVVRRGAWAIFRVENEHCANVAQYKASRDVPLPYRIEPLLDHMSTDSSTVTSPQQTHVQVLGQQTQQQQQQQQRPSGAATTQDTPASQRQRQQQQRQQQRQQDEGGESGNITASSTAVASSFATLRRRTGAFSSWSLSKVLAEAHKQDFEKKRKKPQDGAGGEGAQLGEGYDDDDDDDDDDEDDVERVNRMDVHEAAALRSSDNGNSHSAGGALD